MMYVPKEEMHMNIQTKRLTIAPLQLDMATALHLLSLDEDNRRFVPDEVFETVEVAEETLRYLIRCYEAEDGPLVYALLLDATLIGYVQAVPMEDDAWEIGYHIGKDYTCCGFATEAVEAFLPVIMDKLDLQEIQGICLQDNIASCKVMYRCGFIKAFEGPGLYQGQEREICRFVYRKENA